MADIADRAQGQIEEQLQRAIEAARRPIPAGAPGDCDLCGEWSGRLIGGACAPCRDKYNLE